MKQYPSDLRVFDPQKALRRWMKNSTGKALSTSPDIDNPNDMKEDQKERKSIGPAIRRKNSIFT